MADEKSGERRKTSTEQIEFGVQRNFEWRQTGIG